MVADILVHPVDSWPTMGALQFVEGLKVHSGGCALNSGTALNALGWDVQIEGQVGRDILGDHLIRELESRGMDAAGVRRVDEGTAGSVVVVTSSGERTFLHYIGSNRIGEEALAAWRQLPAARHLHVGGAFLLPGLDGPPMAELLASAHGEGMTTSVDTAYDFSGRWMDLIRPVLPHVDYFLPSYLEAQALTGERDPREQARRLIKEGVGTVGIKLGDQGALVATSTDVWQVDPLSVPARSARASRSVVESNWVSAIPPAGPGGALWRGLVDGGPLGAVIIIGY
jgi:sugar/nucleoside kinase (ribokinase family)